MRTSWIALLFLTGCASNWELAQDVHTGSEISAFYLDQDGDGWGDPASEVQYLKQGDEANKYTANNNRDCDDSDENVTGEVGSICPANLVTGGTTFSAVVYDENEFIAVNSPTEQVWPAYAEDACGPWGWGGQLALFKDSATLNAVETLLSGNAAWAGWVGLVPSDDLKSWVWEDDKSAYDVSATGIGFCGDMPIPDEMDAGRRRLALVKREGSGDWCFGTPSDAKDTNAFPDDAYGYFVCERAAPDQALYADPDTGAAAAQ